MIFPRRGQRRRPAKHVRELGPGFGLERQMEVEVHGATVDGVIAHGVSVHDEAGEAQPEQLGVEAREPLLEAHSSASSGGRLPRARHLDADRPTA